MKDGPKMFLSISDDAGQPLAARFSIRVDGNEHEPGWIDRHGITIQSLSRQREYYAAEGRYGSAEECLHALSVFDRAIERLRTRLEAR